MDVHIERNVHSDEDGFFFTLMLLDPITLYPVVPHILEGPFPNREEAFSQSELALKKTLYSLERFASDIGNPHVMSTRVLH